MSKESNSSGGGIGLVTLVSGIWAFATVPQLTGLKGAFGAAMIGMGTSLSAGIFGIGGALAGAAVGGTLGLLGGKRGVAGGAVFGAIVCGIGGFIYGIPTGYCVAKKMMVNGVASETKISQIMAKPANDNNYYVAKDLPKFKAPSPI